MKTTLRINSLTLEINDRSDVLTKPEIQSAIHEARRNGEFVYCSCQLDRPHRMVPYLVPSTSDCLLRRYSVTDSHDETCPFNLSLSISERGAGMFSVRKTRIPHPSQPTSPNLDHDGYRRHETFIDYARLLIREMNMMSFRHACRRTMGPAGYTKLDLVAGIQTAVAKIQFAQGIDGVIAAQTRGMTLKAGIAWSPHDAVELGDEQADLLVQTIPLTPIEKFSNELWSVQCSDVPISCRKRKGPHIVVAAIAANGHANRIYFHACSIADGFAMPEDSRSGEGNAFQLYIRTHQIFLRVLHCDDINRCSDLLKIDPGVAEQLRHRPDFILPRDPRPVFVEVTSFSGFPRTYPQTLRARLEHYLALGFDCEVLDFSDPKVPQSYTPFQLGI